MAPMARSEIRAHTGGYRGQDIWAVLRKLKAMDDGHGTLAVAGGGGRVVGVKERLYLIVEGCGGCWKIQSQLFCLLFCIGYFLPIWVWG